MKTFVFAILFTTSWSIFAQSPSVYHEYDTYEQKAAAITRAYNGELAFTTNQELLFAEKIETFLPKYDLVKKRYEGKSMLENLRKLKKEESNEMQAILSEPQFRLYLKLRDKFQPLLATATGK